MTASSLPRSAPSAQGVDPSGVLAFVDAAEAAGYDMHSLMVLRHGHVVAEGWWAPYRADRLHLLYSLSKSFTSTAIGIAQGEGLLSVDDPVVGFFPEKTPADASPYTTGMKVRHLLAMASGHAEDTWGRLGKSEGDLVREFLSIPPDKEPGTLFCYNQGCTYTLSAIITKLTGQRLLDYLRPRLLDPLGITDAVWLQTREGIDQGFSGLHVVTESVAKLGLLHLQNGRWGDRQLVPESYLAEAHRKQVDNSNWNDTDADKSDWQQGYGFQFWMCRHHAYRGDGAFGQFCVVLPDADAVVAITAQVTDMQGEIDLVWEHLLPALSGDGPADAGAEPRLTERLAHLSTRVIADEAAPPAEPVTFTPTGSPASGIENLQALRATPSGGRTRLAVVVDGSEQAFELAPGGWAEGGLAALHPRLAEVAITGGWTAGGGFDADVVSLTSPHRLQLRGRAGAEPALEVSWYAAPL